ncbi:MAG TPA: ribulose 1,5-bisphosphate carboxylase, partial [Methanocorpusculum sp.]|nr:ribulose 1,5-bisphosphate carboxylase [Methanocorpusculum sp.]
MKDLIATYYFHPKDGVTGESAAEAIREEQTTRTWTNLSTVNDKTSYVHALDGAIEDLVNIGNGGYLTKIRFPYEIFEVGN